MLVDMKKRLFISHASEDKDDFVRPLAEQLRIHYEVWYDEYSVVMGQSLLEEISRGLKSCDYGVVVLSKHFFGKKWPQAELNGLFALEDKDKKVILPVWKDVNKEEVLGYSAILADRMAARAEEGVPAVVDKIKQAISDRDLRRPIPDSPTRPSDPLKCEHSITLDESLLKEVAAAIFEMLKKAEEKPLPYPPLCIHPDDAARSSLQAEDARKLSEYRAESISFPIEWKEWYRIQQNKERTLEGWIACLSSVNSKLHQRYLRHLMDVKDWETQRLLTIPSSRDSDWQILVSLPGGQKKWSSEISSALLPVVESKSLTTQQQEDAVRCIRASVIMETVNRPTIRSILKGKRVLNFIRITLCDLLREEVISGNYPEKEHILDEICHARDVAKDEMKQDREADDLIARLRGEEEFVESARGVMSTPIFMEWAGDELVTLAIVFTDILDSTALCEELKDERMNEVRRAHFAQSRKLITQYKGREIKTIGDSFMAAFKSVEKALDYAMALHANPGHARVQIRAGIHAGPMRVEENDVFGGTVDFAARVVHEIKDAEIWLSDRAKEDLDKGGAAQFDRLEWEGHPGVQVKGFKAAVTLWSLRK
jgi:class 3 adenylate cyclase